MPEAFGSGGGYEPLAVEGPSAGNVVAFVRGGRALTVVPRLVLGIMEEGAPNWGLAPAAATTTLHLPKGVWTDAITGRVAHGTVTLGEILADLPVALLVRDAG
ncbi:MAG: hypothetical protein NVSMB32_13140 [Actinomycetota bacterium]